MLKIVPEVWGKPKLLGLPVQSTWRAGDKL
jgi:hypothetical protein